MLALSLTIFSLYSIRQYQIKFGNFFHAILKFHKNQKLRDTTFVIRASINLPWGHARSHTKCGPIRFRRYVLYWIQTNRFIDHNCVFSITTSTIENIRLPHSPQYHKGWWFAKISKDGMSNDQIPNYTVRKRRNRRKRRKREREKEII